MGRNNCCSFLLESWVGLCCSGGVDRIDIRKALRIGGARSGYGVARLLRSMQYEVYLVSRDDFEKRFELENRGVIVSLNDQDTDAYDDVDLVVKNPGIPNSHPLVSRFDHVINEIEIATQFHTNGHYYAISGTNGKTTATTLLYEMLLRKDESAVLAGNVGISLSEKVDEIGNADVDVALEISAFQIEGTPNFKPDVYALLNLTPDHLDRFDSEYDYYQAKLALIPNQYTRIPVWSDIVGAEDNPCNDNPSGLCVSEYRKVDC